MSVGNIMPVKKNSEETPVVGLAEKRDQALHLALAAIEKDFGPGQVHQFGEGDAIEGIEFSSSGCFSLDAALGGGYARGRIIEFIGPESSGKTTLALLAVANVLKIDPRSVVYIDMEHALDVNYAAKLGVDINRLLISQPDNGENALNIMDTLVKSGSISMAVIDSVSALVPAKELEGNIGDQSMGVQARLMSQALRMITGVAAKNNATIIFINQIRMKIGVMYGNPETTSGGNSLKFYASQRLDIRKKEKVESNDEVVGNETKVKVIKNKVFPPFREAEFQIIFGEGIDWAQDLVATAEARGVLVKAGSWYSFQGDKAGHGAPAVAHRLRTEPAFAEAVKAALQNKK
jgi:recombination protein RecA